jgi:hypothetical protein
VDRDKIYRKPLYRQDLAGLAELCTNVAHNLSANSKQSDTAHALRVEWLRLSLDRSLDGARAEAENSLKKRLIEFLAEVPTWMSKGL